MPFKTFVAGEILTASDVNTFLGAQAISVFADATARDAAITSPVEGQFAFRTDDDVLEYWDGSAWEEYVSSILVDVFAVAGGGSGGRSNDGNRNSGGGGGGGVFPVSATLISGVAYPLTVGAGGAGITSGGNHGVRGSVSACGPFVIPGGGSGLSGLSSSSVVGSGGSGGGGGNNAQVNRGCTGVPGYGFDGGQAESANSGNGRGAGGGGGGGAAGSNGTTSVGGAGGVGAITTLISTTVATAQSVGEVSGSDVYFSGGGGGNRAAGSSGAGGLGGGTTGGSGPTGTSTSAAANTGGGSGGTNDANTGNGGSGVVIFKLPAKFAVSFSVGVTQHTETVGDDKVYIVKAAGATDTFTIG
jgi:hypothetical protein